MIPRTAIAIAALLGCSPPEEPTAPAAEGAVAVHVTRVEREPLSGTIRLQGELHAFEEVDLHARVAAFVEEVLVDRGAHVGRGDVLVRLHAPELKAERRQSEAARRGQQSTLRRLAQAGKVKGAVAEHDIDLAEARVAEADATTRSLRTLEGYLVIEAPFSGVVSERLVHPGALVTDSSDAPMLRLQAIDTLRLQVAVPEEWAGSIVVGEGVEFEVLAWPGRRFSGVVARSSDRVDRSTRTLAVELDVENDEHILVPGMYAEVHWPLRRPHESLFVPATAIVETTLDRFVVVVRNGVAHRISVRRGAATADRVEIFGALELGDLVVTRGREDIEEGTSLETTSEPG